MSPLTVFLRTLLKSSAVFIGTAAIFLHPQLEFRAASTQVGARQAPREEAVDELIKALKDPDAGVRRQVARTLAQMHNTRAVPALAAALKDADPDMRAIIASALGELGDARAVPALREALILLAATPFPIGVLQFFPAIDRIERDQGLVLVDLILREHA